MRFIPTLLATTGGSGVREAQRAEWNGVNMKSHHPWAGEDLSLKIDELDQTIWICILQTTTL